MNCTKSLLWIHGIYVDLCLILLLIIKIRHDKKSCHFYHFFILSQQYKPVKSADKPENPISLSFENHRISTIFKFWNLPGKLAGFPVLKKTGPRQFCWLEQFCKPWWRPRKWWGYFCRKHLDKKVSVSGYFIFCFQK
jgi:hypothetical protein